MDLAYRLRRPCSAIEPQLTDEGLIAQNTRLRSAKRKTRLSTHILRMFSKGSGWGLKFVTVQCRQTTCRHQRTGLRQWPEMTPEKRRLFRRWIREEHMRPTRLQQRPATNYEIATEHPEGPRSELTTPLLDQPRRPSESQFIVWAVATSAFIDILIYIPVCWFRSS